MSGTGRRLDPIWQNFDKIKDAKTSCTRARCKICKKEMAALVARMKTHLTKCKNSKLQDEDVLDVNSFNEGSDDDDLDGNRQKIRKTNSSTSVVSASCLPKSPPKQAAVVVLDSFVTRTTIAEKHKIDMQMARFIYSTNSAFRLVDHPEFQKLINILRPGYTPPNRAQIASHLLDDVHSTIWSYIQKTLKDKTVCMALDGWSNIHNEPIVCVSVTDVSQEAIHLIETIDTGDASHTSEYLLKLTVDAIKKCQKFGCTVRSIVTDNASNMKRMRMELSKCEELGMPDILSYGCGAHILNLLAKDIDTPALNIKESVKKVMKYFKNHHFPAAKYKQAGGAKLKLPQDVRWNTLTDCLESYLDNWPFLSKVCTENPVAIEANISTIVNDISLKVNIHNYLQKLKVISTSLDKVQAESCSIGAATEVWIQMISKARDLFNEDEFKCCEKRFNMAMTPAHYLANLLDHRFGGQNLSQSQLEEAMEYVAAYHSKALPYVIQYQAKASPFKNYLFLEDTIVNVTPLAWWNSLQRSVNPEIYNLAIQLHSAVASSAGIERLFSSFGLVHSKLRNRLGTEKASKLVSIMRALNKNSSIFEED